MKRMGKNGALLLAGVLVGLCLGPIAHAVGEVFTAVPSFQRFYVEDREVALEAYAINGYNYVKLRDIGQAVGFNVYYDAQRDAGVMEPDKPYTGQAPAAAPQGSDGGEDYAAQANAAVFTGPYTRGMYNAFRYAVTHPEEIRDGSYENRVMGTAAEVDNGAVLDVARRAGGGAFRYSVVDAIDGSAAYLTAKYREEYDKAAAHVRPFLDSISHLSQREQVREMVWYIADRMTYSEKIKTVPSEILAQDEVIYDAGSCMTYSCCLNFLCEQAGIPCILVDSDIHQWNLVYVDGAWWHVDPTANKGNIQSMAFYEVVNGVQTEVQKPEAERRAILEETREDMTVFYETMEGDVYGDETPEITAFLQEVMVPGSTR